MTHNRLSGICVICQYHIYMPWVVLFRDTKTDMVVCEYNICEPCEAWLEALMRGPEWLPGWVSQGEVWIDPDSIRFYDHALSAEEIYEILKDEETQ